jgi:uncharacterized protein (DUF3084 family)
MTNESMSSLKQELDITKRKLQNMNQLYTQIKDRNNYLQNRMSSLVNEKSEIQEELLKYKSMDLYLKSKEVVNFKIDYLKIQHRIQVTKKLLDEQREDNIKLNMKIVGLNNDVKDLFEIIDEISENVDKLIDENFLLKDLIIEYQNQNFWKYLSEKKPENLIEYEKEFEKDSKISQIYKK